MFQTILLNQSINRALDRLAAIMDAGEPRDQIKAAALTIDTVLRLHRIVGQETRRAGQLARNEVRCILVEQEAQKSSEKLSIGQARAA